MVGGEQRLRLARGQSLDPERDRRGDQHAVEAVGGRERRTAVGVVILEIDERLGLAGQAERPATAAAQQHRRLAAPLQRAQQRLGPEMLVDVDRSAHVPDVMRFTEPLHSVWTACQRCG